MIHQSPERKKGSGDSTSTKMNVDKKVNALDELPKAIQANLSQLDDDPELKSLFVPDDDDNQKTNVTPTPQIRQKSKNQSSSKKTTAAEDDDDSYTRVDHYDEAPTVFYNKNSSGKDPRSEDLIQNQKDVLGGTPVKKTQQDKSDISSKKTFSQEPPLIQDTRSGTTSEPQKKKRKIIEDELSPTISSPSKPEERENLEKATKTRTQQTPNNTPTTKMSKSTKSHDEDMDVDKQETKPETITMKVERLAEGVLDKLFDVSQKPNRNIYSVFEDQRYLKSAKFLLDNYTATTSQPDLENQETIMESTKHLCAIGSIDDHLNSDSLCDFSMKNTLPYVDIADVLDNAKIYGKFMRSLLSISFPAPTVKASMFLMDNFYFYKCLLEIANVESKVGPNKVEPAYKHLLNTMALQIPSPYEHMMFILTDIIFTGSQNIHQFKDEFDNKKKDFKKSFENSKIFFKTFFVNSVGLGSSGDEKMRQEHNYKFVKSSSDRQILPAWFLSSLDQIENVIDNIDKQQQFSFGAKKQQKNVVTELGESNTKERNSKLEHLKQLFGGLFGSKDKKSPLDISSTNLMRLVAIILTQPYYVAKNFLNANNCEDVQQLLVDGKQNITPACLLELLNGIKLYDSTNHDSDDDDNKKSFLVDFCDKNLASNRHVVEKCNLLSQINVFQTLHDFVTKIYAGDERPMYINPGHIKVSEMSEIHTVYTGSSSAVTSNIPEPYSAMFTGNSDLFGIDDENKSEKNERLNISTFTEAIYKYSRTEDGYDIVLNQNISTGSVNVKFPLMIHFFSRLLEETKLLGDFLGDNVLSLKKNSSPGKREVVSIILDSNVDEELHKKYVVEITELNKKANGFKIMKLFSDRADPNLVDNETIVALVNSRGEFEEFYNYLVTLNKRVKMTIDNLRDLKLAQTTYDGFRSKPLKTTQQFTEHQEKRDSFLLDSIIAILSTPTNLEISAVLDSLAISCKSENEEEMAWLIKKPLFTTVSLKTTIKILSSITNFPIIMLRNWIEMLSIDSPSDSGDPVATFISLCDRSVTTRIFAYLSQHLVNYRIANLLLFQNLMESNKLMFRYLPEQISTAKNLGGRESRRSSKVIVKTDDQLGEKRSTNSGSSQKKSKRCQEGEESSSEDKMVEDDDWSPEKEKKAKKASKRIENSQDEGDGDNAGEDSDHEDVANADDDVDEGVDEDDVTDESEEVEAQPDTGDEDDEDDD